MTTPRRPLPDHARAKRDEALDLSNENASLLREAKRESNAERRARLMAEVDANNERIGRLMEQLGAKQ